MKKLVGEFVHLTIDGDKDPASATYLQAKSYPTIALFAPSGELIAWRDEYYFSADDAVRGFISYLTQAATILTKDDRTQEAWWIYTKLAAMTQDKAAAAKYRGEAESLVKAGKAKADPKYRWKMIPDLAKDYKPKPKKEADAQKKDAATE